jgi:hypothetical protein
LNETKFVGSFYSSNNDISHNPLCTSFKWTNVTNEAIVFLVYFVECFLNGGTLEMLPPMTKFTLDLKHKQKNMYMYIFSKNICWFINNVFIKLDPHYVIGAINWQLLGILHTFWWLVGWFLVFNSTFSNISAISWRPVLVVEKARVPWENHRPWASNYITFDQTAHWIESAWIEGIYL